jgi:apolipoprotein N-acyltransferase
MGRRSKQNEHKAAETAVTDHPAENQAVSAAQGASAPAVPGWWAWVAALTGGVAGGLAFEPFNLYPLIILAPLGCFLAIRWSATPRGAFLRALAFGWVYYFISLHWLLRVRFYAPSEFLGVLGVMTLAVYIGLYPALAGLVLRKWLWTANATFQFALFGSLWLLAEWLRTLGRLAVPLAELGHAWATHPWLIQIAAWLGELGVSLLVLWAAGLLFLAGRLWTVRRLGADAPPQATFTQTHLRRLIPLFTAGLAGWLGLSAFIAHSWNARMNEALARLGTKRLQVALLQPNIPQSSKLASYASPDEAQRRDLQEQITKLQEDMLAAHAHGQWGLIVLPETSFTAEDFNRNKALQDRISAMAIKAQADLLVSASRDESTTKTFEVYNTAYFVKKDGVFDKEVYDKIRLVPFGEAVPYFDLIPGFQESVVGIGSFNEGKNRTLFTTGDFRFGVLICFESTFSSMARALVKKGADFLTVVTNDAWYEWRDPDAPYSADAYNNTGAAAHHHLSLLRAVETRRWVLRCANTGISSIISPAGTVTANGDQNWRGMIQGTIAPAVYTGRTFFTMIGNW